MSRIYKPYDSGLFIGRMSHIHSGHEHVINQALMLCDRVLILVGSAQDKGSLKNPWDIMTRMEMIKEVYPGDEVIVRPLPDYSTADDLCPEWGNHVLSAVRQHIRKLPEIMVYGNDDPRSAWFQHQRDEVKGITEMIVAREKIPVSATQMREWLFLDDFDNWSRYANSKLHKHYDRLRSEMLRVPDIETLAKKHLRPTNQGWTDKPVTYLH